MADELTFGLIAVVSARGARLCEHARSNHGDKVRRVVLEGQHRCAGRNRARSAVEQPALARRPPDERSWAVPSADFVASAPCEPASAVCCVRNSGAAHHFGVVDRRAARARNEKSLACPRPSLGVSRVLFVARADAARPVRVQLFWCSHLPRGHAHRRDGRLRPSRDDVGRDDAESLPYGGAHRRCCCDQLEPVLPERTAVQRLRRSWRRQVREPSVARVVASYDR